MNTEQNTEQNTELESEYGGNLREIFMSCPADAMSEEFRAHANAVWPEDEQTMPSPDVMIKLFRFLLEEQELGNAHLHESVVAVMSAISSSSIDRAELDAEQIHQLHLDNGMVLDEDGVYVLAPN